MCCGYGKVSACGDFVGGMYWVWRLIFEKKIVFCSEGKWWCCWGMMDCGWLGFIALFVLMENSF